MHMAAPGEFANAPAPKKGGLWKVFLIVGAVLALGCIGICVGGWFLVGRSVGLVAPAVQCMSEISLNQAAIKAYADANDGVLPPAEAWQDEISSFYEAEYAKWEPLQKELGNLPGPSAMNISVAKPGEAIGCTFGEPDTGFAYNSDVAGKKLAEVDSSTMLLFETEKKEYNQAMPFVEKDNASSPKIENKARGWFGVSVGGTIKADEEYSRVNEQMRDAAEQMAEARRAG
jgi:hypothetical protein